MQRGFAAFYGTVPSKEEMDLFNIQGWVILKPDTTK